MSIATKTKGAVYVAPHAQLPDCESAFFADTLPIGHVIDVGEVEREFHESPSITGTCSVKADAETLKRLFQLTAEPPVYDVQFRRNGILYKRVKCHVESTEDGLSFEPTGGDITGGTIIIEETTK